MLSGYQPVEASRGPSDGKNAFPRRASTALYDQHRGRTGWSPIRDAALLSVLYGTGVVLAELVGLRVSDYLTVSGTVRHNSVLRAQIAYNDLERPLFWVSPKVIAAVSVAGQRD
jgi:integrase